MTHDFYLDRLMAREAHLSLHSFAVGMVLGPRVKKRLLIGLCVRIFRGYLRAGNMDIKLTSKWQK